MSQVRDRYARLARRAGCLAAGLALAALAGAVPARTAPAALADEPVSSEPTSVQSRTSELIPSLGRSTIELSAASRDDDVLRTLEMELGKSVLVKTDYRVKRISVGNPKTLEVVVLSPRELHFVPKRIGGTNVVLWDVQGEPQAAIDIQVGTTHSSMERQLRRVLGVDEIFVESAGKAVVLRGTVPSPVAAERAVAVARAFFQEDAEKRVVNVLEVGGNQQVMLEVIVAEMTRSLSRNLTSNFATFIESDGKTFQFFNLLDNLSAVADGTAFTRPPWPTSSADLALSGRANLVGQFLNCSANAATCPFALSAVFEALEDEGLTKILAEPHLLARSGQSASFLVGGEVPIPVTQGGATAGSITIEFKEFGVGVQFTPTVLGPDRIHLQVAPEVSEPDFALTALSGAGAPAFITRRASTAVELGDGQSFAIAGLLDDRVRSSVQKYPVLGDVPILGALFRSVQFQKSETELVLIVTPRLVKPLPPGPHPLPTDSFVEPNAFETYLLGALEGQSPREPAGAGGLIGPAGHRVPSDLEGGSR